MTDKQKEEVAKINTPNKYIWKVIAEFLCRFHNVSDVPYIMPFGSRTYTWEVMRENVLQVELSTPERVSVDIRTPEDAGGSVFACSVGNGKLLNDPQPKDKFIHPIQKVPMDVDPNNVYIYNITARHVKSSIPIDVAPRLNYYHTSMAALQNTVEQDNMFAEAGAVRGAFTVIKPTGPDGDDIECCPMPELTFAYQNRFFAQTMALVTEQNILNGIVKIPHEVCVAANLPVWKGTIPDPEEAMITGMMKSMNIDTTTEQGSIQKQGFIDQWKTDIMERFKDAPKSECFYAVPINHVLAWGLASEEYMSQRGVQAEQFRYVGPDNQAVVLYFLVQSAYFDQMLNSFKEKWLNKLDVRPLKDVAVEFLPIIKQEYEGIPQSVTHVTGQLSMRFYITYSAAPRLSAATIANLAPALCVGFPNCHHWTIDEVSKQLAIEKNRAQAQKKK